MRQTQIFPFSFFCDFVKKPNLCSILCLFFICVITFEPMSYDLSGFEGCLKYPLPLLSQINYNSLSTSKLPSELQFCERYKDSWQKTTARNGHITDFCQSQILGNTLYLFIICVSLQDVRIIKKMKMQLQKTLIKTGIPFYFNEYRFL